LRVPESWIISSLQGRYQEFPQTELHTTAYFRGECGGKGGMYFVNREKAYADQLERMKKHGIADEPIAKM
jgi:hypothetical protein